MNKNNKGRPKKPKHKKITREVKLGLTENQYLLFSSLAEAHNQNSISELFRYFFMKMINNDRIISVSFNNEDEITKYLRSLSNNLNQSTKAIHIANKKNLLSDRITSQLLAEIKKCSNALMSIDAHIKSKLLGSRDDT